MTLQPIHSDAGASFAYYGEREGWLVALAVHRDSDALERSNWDTIAPAMLADHPDDAAIERMSSWLVGWIDYLLVRPGTPAADEAQRWADRLADYPVADDEAYSALKYAEEWCVRCDRGTRKEHDTDRRYGCCARFRSADDADEIRGRWQWRADYRDGRAYGRAYGDRPSPYVGTSVAWAEGYRDGMTPDAATAPAWLAHWRGL